MNEYELITSLKPPANNEGSAKNVPTNNGGGVPTNNGGGVPTIDAGKPPTKNVGLQKTIQKTLPKDTNKRQGGEYAQVLSKIEFLGKNIPQAEIISEGREAEIKSCIKKFGVDRVLRMLDKASESPLTAKGWFNFDFMWKDTAKSPNFLKILEGTYDSAFDASKPPSPAGHNISTDFTGYRGAGFGAGAQS